MDQAVSTRELHCLLDGTDGQISACGEHTEATEVAKPRLISDSYQKQQEELHQTTTYGTVGETYGLFVSKIIEKMGITHLLDYGCGSRMSLTRSLKVKHKLTYQGYDPGAGIAELATAPIPAQMVCCIDVLEHIEPEYLDNVLNHLEELTEAVAFITIHTGPARKVLSDGRNAHLTQEPIEWWLQKLMYCFDIQTVQKTDEHAYYAIFTARPKLEMVNGAKISINPAIVS